MPPSDPNIIHRSNSTSSTSPNTTTTTARSSPSRSTNAAASSSSRRSSSSSNRCQWVVVTVLLGSCLVAYQAAWTYWLPGRLVPDTELDLDRGRTVTRRRPDQLYKMHHGEKLPTTPFDGVMEGHLTLTNIQIPKAALFASVNEADGTEQLYSGVKATFCHISWDLQDDNPSMVPMFHDLQKASFLCPGTLFTADLWEIARQAEQYDARNHTFAATKPGEAQIAVPPTAVIFHESRCGSTLAANVLAAFAPHHTRVYSEAAPPLEAILACSSDATTTTTAACDPESHTKLIQDVFYMMGRVTRPSLPQYVFYKIQSVGVQSIDAFVKAMPTTPWMFAYRDSVEILMSHFHHYQKGLKVPGTYTPVCLRNYGKRQQPALLTELVAAVNRQVSQLSREEYCAAHLASLAEAAVREHTLTKHLVASHAVTAITAGDSSTQQVKAPPHWFVNYNELPYKIWETILPSLVVNGLNHEEIERMHAAAKVYSKARGDGTQHWKEDSTLKQGKAPPWVKEAAKVFLDPVYQRMESIRKSLDTPKQL